MNDVTFIITIKNMKETVTSLIKTQFAYTASCIFNFIIFFHMSRQNPLQDLTDSLLFRIETCLLHSKSGDEDVDDDGEKHQPCGHIIHYVQLPLIGHIIEVFAC